MNSFWRGLALCSALHGVLQDWLGLEGYIQFCRAHWTNLSWWFWVPIIIALLIGEAAAIISRHIEERRGGWHVKSRLHVHGNMMDDDYERYH
jgi:hypothetical protein